LLKYFRVERLSGEKNLYGVGKSENLVFVSRPKNPFFNSKGVPAEEVLFDRRASLISLRAVILSL
jgi:hypothetical protein